MHCGEDPDLCTPQNVHNKKLNKNLQSTSNTELLVLKEIYIKQYRLLCFKKFPILERPGGSVG